MADSAVLFIIDLPEKLDLPTDTSLALMRECQKRNYRVYWTTLQGLRLHIGTPWARAREALFSEDRELFHSGDPHELDLSQVSMVFMRKDPPVDLPYLHATYILDRLPEHVRQINPSRTLRSNCEKLIPSLFPDLVPETLVSSDPDQIRFFLRTHGRIVIKPLEDCSGHGIYVLMLDDPNAVPLIASMTQDGGRYLQAQSFLPEISQGDKRVLLLDGDILGWVRRIPAKGDFRSNINAGGRCELCEMTDHDRLICDRIGAWLKQEGIVFAGIDIVGRYVLEVNITSPSCLREINDLKGLQLEQKILDKLENK